MQAKKIMAVLFAEGLLAASHRPVQWQAWGIPKE
jgi:hypothetical protein